MCQETIYCDVLRDYFDMLGDYFDVLGDYFDVLGGYFDMLGDYFDVLGDYFDMLGDYFGVLYIQETILISILMCYRYAKKLFTSNFYGTMYYTACPKM